MRAGDQSRARRADGPSRLILDPAQEGISECVGHGALLEVVVVVHDKRATVSLNSTCQERAAHLSAVATIFFCAREKNVDVMPNEPRSWSTLCGFEAMMSWDQQGRCRRSWSDSQYRGS